MLLKTHSFEFGEYFLDTEEKILLCQGETVSITPKVYELLYFLVKNHGHLVEKDAIMGEVWADSFVEESNLTYTIRQLRKILEDNARDPKFIETVSGRGYRFIAEVSEVNSETNGHPKKIEVENSFENGSFLADKFSNKTLSKKYLFQRNLLLITTFGILIVFGILSANFFTGNEKSLASKKLKIKTIKTNGKSLNATISPDGKYIAYSDENDEKISLWLQDLESSEKVQILSPSDEFYFGLVFSSDGKSIYFVRGNQRRSYKADVYRVSAFGGIPEKIIEHAEGWISLSPDDERISFVRADENANYSLYIADSDGKNERKLVTTQAPERIGANQFSPDSRTIAFAAGQSNDGTNDFRLMKVDVESKIATEISTQKFFNIKHLAWMPNGKDLLISAREAYGNSYKLWKISDNSKQTENLMEDAASYSELSLDKAGKKLLVTRLKNSFQMSLSSFNDPDKKRVMAAASTVKFISDSEIVYSTDQGELWKIGINGAGQQQLTSDDSINSNALISPGGKQLFFRSNRSGSHQIWRMDLDGSNKVQITKKVGGFPKFISSDQKRIFFESNLYRTIWEVSADGENEEKEKWDRKLFYSAFSKDGAKIAYLHHDELKNRKLDIEIANIKDKSLIRKISLAEQGMKPVKLAWLNDNETLLYITRNEFGYKLWKQKIDTDSPQFIGDLGNELIRDFSVSPNNENFIVIVGEWLEDIILIEGFN
jgi:Tol biopolymer transport system component/DNA-binding winged helix-turn-helix (wHTH) protein